MCGIAGFLQRTPPERLLEPMLRRIEHRGPDGQGTWTGRSGEWHVALGHTRLAILDIAGGAQPMSAPDASAHVTYNGELYNFLALRRSLEQGGTPFHTRSDTEVILRHVAGRWNAGLADLDGMFAFALWDARRSRLLLARDRAGIKPLYYAPLPDGGVVFGSELTVVLEHPAVRRVLSPRGLQGYFFSDYVHPPYTLVEGVHKVPPGHFVEWTDGRVTEPKPFWKLAFGAMRASGSPAALADETWSRLGRSVEGQLMADVPVGVFLSGGIDSSCVAVLAQQKAGRRLKTFSIAFEDPTFDESSYARIVARQIGSEHVEERLGEHNVLEVVDLALSRLDEPLADPSYLPTFLLSRLASRHVKVVLGGDGGDELFAGYPTYRAHRYGRIYRMLRGRRLLHHAVGRLRERDRYQSLEWKLKRFVGRWDDDPVRRHFRWMSSLDLPDLARGLPRTAASLPPPLDGGHPAAPDWLAETLALDFTTYLPGSVLTKVDRASMAHGLEVRPPILGNDVIDWAFSVPSSLKLHRGTTKYILKRAATGSLPPEILHRPKKGFGIPLRAWLRGPLRDRVARALEPSPLWDSRLLDREAFRGWAGMNAERMGDYSKPLWALLVLDEWIRRESVTAS